ncbi:MAG TPA: PPOX class F420-dependent oxidoreductase, partial [Mycobacteriales bacterium]|nr:PPOX class F420-dependent oxidoreductase [Mycobacteriales bacterium]
ASPPSRPRSSYRADDAARGPPEVGGPMTALPPQAKEWIDGLGFAVLATLDAEGAPQQVVMWVARDGDDVLISTVEGRIAHRNLSRDPRACVVVQPPGNPYQYVEIRGTASMTSEGGDDFISALSAKYRGVTPYPLIGPDEPRVVIRLTPDKVVLRA